MDNLLFGLNTTLIGMLVVFLGLVILIGCITVMGFVIGGRLKKKQPEAPQTADIVPAEPETVPEPEEEENDDALVAAITAAIYCVWDKPDTGFTVRRIRRLMK